MTVQCAMVLSQDFFKFSKTFEVSMSLLTLPGLPEELLIQILSCLSFQDAIQLRSVNKSMNELVSIQIDEIQEKEERARQFRLLKEEHNKSGFRSVESAVDNEAFEQGVIDGYVEHCNLSFIDGQWKGFELLSNNFLDISISILD